MIDRITMEVSVIMKRSDLVASLRVTLAWHFGISLCGDKDRELLSDPLRVNEEVLGLLEKASTPEVDLLRIIIATAGNDFPAIVPANDFIRSRKIRESIEVVCMVFLKNIADFSNGQLMDVIDRCVRD